VRPYNPERGDEDVRAALRLVDCGDVDVIPSQIEKSFAAIESVLGRLLRQGQGVAFTIGGDGSVSLPQMRAVSKLHPDLVALHFDAHTDALEPPGPGVHNSGTQFHYAAVERLIDPAASWHIGLRGTLPAPGTFKQARALGYPLLTLEQFLEEGIAPAMRRIIAAIGSRPVYLCWDMDVIDPAFAPGVAAPSWGGLTARESLQIVRMLEPLNIVHADFNTVSPPHDVNGAAGSLAAQLMYDVMTGVAGRRPAA
jgi:agmatinase